MLGQWVWGESRYERTAVAPSFDYSVSSCHFFARVDRVSFAEKLIGQCERLKITCSVIEDDCERRSFGVSAQFRPDAIGTLHWENTEATKGANHREAELEFSDTNVGASPVRNTLRLTGPLSEDPTKIAAWLRTRLF